MSANSIEYILEVLQQAASQDPNVLKPAEAKLGEWETQPGFYTALYGVLINHNIDLNIRWLAVLCIKNGVEKYWRKNAPNAITEEEKQGLRNALVSNFHEPVNQIAVQIAALVSKIARIDCPKDWPELYPTLLQAIENTNPLVQFRALLTLHYVVKAISSKRLPGDRRAFQDFTLTIYAFILNLWNNFTEMFIRDIMQDASNEQISNNLEKALLTLRILRKLTVHGFYKPHLNADCMQFMKVVFDKARTSLECRLSLKTLELVQTCEKFVVHLTKILYSVLDVHPFSFVDFIKPTLEFVHYYIFSDPNESLLFERFTIQCFNLMKTILICAEFKPSKVLENTKEPETLRAHYTISEFFQPGVLRVICRKLVFHYFLLTKEDLELWDADPETFVNDEAGESWKCSFRPSMECLFVSLFPKFRELMSPILLEIISETNVVVSPDDMEGILKKDAVYNAIGLAAYNMYDEVDFDQWFTSTLVQELKIKHNNYRIIRRRVSWLIGNWTSIKLAAELRPTLYECIYNLLDPEEDMAIKLTASTAFRFAMDDFEFSPEQFKPFLEPIFLRLLDLLKVSNECETKMQVLNVITVMAERLGDTLLPNSMDLVQYLPFLWHESEEHNMLRCAIVSTLVQLVNLDCTSSQHEFLIHVIQLGTNPSDKAILYLLEDCLELWRAVLKNAKEMNLGFVQLFNNMPLLLDYSTENWKIYMEIIGMHLLLDPGSLFNDTGTRLVMVLDSLMGDLRVEALLLLAGLLETFLRCSPEMGSETIKPILPKVIEFAIRNENGPSCFCVLFSIISRVILASHSIFNEALRELSLRSRQDQSSILESLLAVWTNRQNAISEHEDLKIMSLALCNILTTQNQLVLQYFAKILIFVVEALHDITWNENQVDSLYLGEESSDTTYDHVESEHDARFNKLIVKDPVSTILLKDYLKTQLYTLRNQLGPEQFEKLMQSVNSDTVTQMKEFIAL